MAPRLAQGASGQAFGQWITDVATGKTRWQVALDLLYGQVKKSYCCRRLARVERRMRLGELSRLTNRLKSLGFSGTLNTAFVKRINPSASPLGLLGGASGQVLTLRHAPAALSRRSWAAAQLTSELLAHLQWWRTYYHFCRPHLSLRLKSEVPLARQGQQTPRRYGPRTPAMAADLTDHIWSVQELLAFPVGL